MFGFTKRTWWVRIYGLDVERLQWQNGDQIGVAGEIAGVVGQQLSNVVPAHGGYDVGIVDLLAERSRLFQKAKQHFGDLAVVRGDSDGAL